MTVQNPDSKESGIERERDRQTKRHRQRDTQREIQISVFCKSTFS